MKELDSLLEEIDAYCKDRGIKPTYFGQLVSRDRGLVDRLRTGGQTLSDKIERIRKYMRDNPTSKEAAE